MICSRAEECTKAEEAGLTDIKCPNKNRKKCVLASDRRRFIKCEEKNKKYILENTEENHVILYQVDGGMIVSDHTVPAGITKCDFMYVICRENRIAVLTELKGVDVPKSLRQIEGTLLMFKSYFKMFSNVYGRVVVASSTPDLKASPAYVKLEKLLRRSYHGNIKIAERKFAEKDTELGK